MDPWFNDETQRWEDSEGRPRRPVLRSQTTSSRSIDDVRRDVAWVAEHNERAPWHDLDRAVLRAAARDDARRRVAALRAAWDATLTEDIATVLDVDPAGLADALEARAERLDVRVDDITAELIATLNRWST